MNISPAIAVAALKFLHGRRVCLRQEYQTAKGKIKARVVVWGILQYDAGTEAFTVTDDVSEVMLTADASHIKAVILDEDGIDLWI